MNKLRWGYLIITELGLIGLGFLAFTRETVIVFCCINLTLFWAGYAKIIKDEHFPGAVWVRRTSYFLPYLLAVMLSRTNLKLTFISIPACIAAVGIALLLLSPRFKEIKLSLNSDFIAMCAPVSLNALLLEIYSLFGSAVFQELFFRNMLLDAFSPHLPTYLAVFFTSFLFIGIHLFHFAADQLFSWKDYLVQFLFGIVVGWIYILTESVVLPIIVHLVYNLQGALVYGKRYIVWRGLLKQEKENIVV